MKMDKPMKEYRLDEFVFRPQNLYIESADAGKHGPISVRGTHRRQDRNTSHMASGSKTILLVEDEDEQSSILSKAFLDLGYDTIVTTTAESALACIAGALPDLMLVDIKLSDLDGLTFFHKLKEMGVTQKVPFIFLTAYNSLEMATTAKHEGAADYIVKPYDLDYVVDVVDQRLRGSR